MLFSKDKNRNMEELLVEHGRMVIRCVEDYQAMIEALRVLDVKKARDLQNSIDDFETRADDVHRKNVVEVCKGSFFGYLREDLLQLMEMVDNIADSAKEAEMALMWRKVPEEVLAEFLNDTAMNYVDKSVNTAKSLIDLLESLDMKRDRIIEKVHAVEHLEEEADTIKYQLFQDLYSRADRYDPLTVLQLKEFIDITDNIADSAEDASDVVLIMLAKGYS